MQVIQPLLKQLLCLPDEKEETTKSGIFIPTTGIEKPKTAKVVRVARGVTVKEGITVVYKPYATHDITFDGISYFLIDENDILASIE